MKIPFCFNRHNDRRPQQMQIRIRTTSFAKCWAPRAEWRHGKHVTNGNERAHRRDAQGVLAWIAAKNFYATSASAKSGAAANAAAANRNSFLVINYYSLNFSRQLIILWSLSLSCPRTCTSLISKPLTKMLSMGHSRFGLCQDGHVIS